MLFLKGNGIITKVHLTKHSHMAIQIPIVSDFQLPYTYFVES
jgi:hypothetical protein